MKENCIRSKSKAPLEERSKTLYVSKAFEKYRAKMETNVDIKLGKFLRVNRLIQAKGTFAMVKNIRYGQRRHAFAAFSSASEC